MRGREHSESFAGIFGPSDPYLPASAVTPARLPLSGGDLNFGNTALTTNSPEPSSRGEASGPRLSRHCASPTCASRRAAERRESHEAETPSRTERGWRAPPEPCRQVVLSNTGRRGTFPLCSAHDALLTCATYVYFPGSPGRWDSVVLWYHKACALFGGLRASGVVQRSLWAVVIMFLSHVLAGKG